MTMNNITKTSIGQYFKRLEKYNFIVRNLQNNRAVSPGTKDLPDLIIFGRKEIYWVEIKIGNDRLSEGQKELGRRLQMISNYFIATEKNYLHIFDKILGE